jgi:kynurenine formamidase
VIGSDTEDLECVPAANPSEVLPVHVELITRRGIHIIELLYLEQLAASAAYEFLFICLSLRVRGATGSMVRPIAIT